MKRPSFAQPSRSNPLGGELAIWHQYDEECRISLRHGSMIVIG